MTLALDDDVAEERERISRLSLGRVELEHSGGAEAYSEARWRESVVILPGGRRVRALAARRAQKLVSAIIASTRTIPFKDEES